MIDIVRIIISILLSSLIGVEREKSDKPAGLRTCILVCFTMTIMMILNQKLLILGRSFDFARVPSYAIMSVGFLGSGVIILNRKRLEGITTASVLLSLVAIGLLCGMGELILAGVSTLVVFGVLKLKYVEFIIRKKKPKKKKRKKKNDENKIHTQS